MASKKKSAGGGKRPRATPEQIRQAGQMLRNTTKSVTEVAKTLGISQGVVFYHFPGGKRAMGARVEAKKPATAAVHQLPKAKRGGPRKPAAKATKLPFGSKRKAA